MEIATTTMSSRGQVVIPREMRKKIKTGEKLIILENNNQFIIKRASDANKNFEQDISRAKEVDKILKNYESGKGKFTQMSGEDFLKELEEW